MLANTALLGGRELVPLFGEVADKWYLEVISAVITGLELLDGTTSNMSNIKLLVYLLVGHLIHKVVYRGIKVARVLIVVSLKGQLGLGLEGVCNIIQEMEEKRTWIVGNIICLLCQGHHGLHR